MSSSCQTSSWHVSRQSVTSTAPYSPSSLVFLLCSFASSSFARQSPLCSSALPSPSPPPPSTMVHIFHIFLRPAVATSIISLLSVINPVSAHVKTPSRPRAHAAAIQLRSFNAVDADFARRANVPLEVRQLNGRGFLGDTLGGVGDTVDNVVGDLLGGGGGGGGGGGSTSTSNSPANSTPAPSATTATQGTGGGNTGNPGSSGASTVTTGSANPTTSNTQNTRNTRTNPSSATTSNSGQQTPKASTITTGKALLPQPAGNQSHDHYSRCKRFYRSSCCNRLAHREFRSDVGRFRFTYSLSYQQADNTIYSEMWAQTIVSLPRMPLLKGLGASKSPRSLRQKHIFQLFLTAPSQPRLK